MTVANYICWVYNELLIVGAAFSRDLLVILNLIADRSRSPRANYDYASSGGISLKRIRNTSLSKLADVILNPPTSPVDSTWFPMQGQAS